MRAVLLLSVDFLPVHKVVSVLSLVHSMRCLCPVSFMERHSDRRSLSSTRTSYSSHHSDSVMIIVHLKYLLLLCIQICWQRSTRSSSRFSVVIGNITSVATSWVFRVVIVELVHLEAFENKELILNIQWPASLVRTKLSRFKSILSSGASLCVQMFSQIWIRRFNLFAILIPVIILVLINRTSSAIESMSLIHMVDVVLLMNSLTVLILEDLGKNSFGTWRLRRMINSSIISTTLNTHASTMDSIELIFNIVDWTRWSITSCSSTRISLNWWSRDVKFSSLTGNQILSLITTGLDQ